MSIEQSKTLEKMRVLAPRSSSYAYSRLVLNAKTHIYYKITTDIYLKDLVTCSPPPHYLSNAASQTHIKSRVHIIHLKYCTQPTPTHNKIEAN